MRSSTTLDSFDEYIAKAPASVQPVLRKIRQTIRKPILEAEEVISYGMPSFKKHGILVHIGAFKEHIGLFPPIHGNATIEKAVKRYAGPKGNLRFPLDEPIPYDLIGRIAKLRVKQDEEKAATRKAKKTKVKS